MNAMQLTLCYLVLVFGFCYLTLRLLMYYTFRHKDIVPVFYTKTVILPPKVIHKETIRWKIHPSHKRRIP